MAPEGYRTYPCDVCGSTSAVLLPHSKEYTGGQAIHICKRCGFVYVIRRRPYKKIADVWSKQLFGKAYTAKSPLMLARHHYVAEFIDQAIGLKGKKVCDIGAGEGQFLGIIKCGYGAHPFGIEPSGRNCLLLKKLAIPCFNGTVEDYCAAGRKGKFDIVTIMWTLEKAVCEQE